MLDIKDYIDQVNRQLNDTNNYELCSIQQSYRLKK